MTTLTVTDDDATIAMKLCMGVLNAACVDGVVGTYGMVLAGYVACKNTLAMTDADYLRFCEHIMNEYGQDKIVKEPNNG